MMSSLVVLLLFLAIIAFLYSSVGHGGASGYLAVMAMMGVAPAIMKPSALVMNLAVSLFSFIGFYRAGHFKFKLFWPFAIASVPLAYLGGTMTLSDSIYKKILAICILISIFRLIFQIRQEQEETKPISTLAGLASGGAIGLISGMIGIGGGIVLTPLMLLMRWATLKQTAAVSALFIFVNSLSGLYGQLQKGGIQVTDNFQWSVAATIIGGLLGSYYGSQKFNVPTLRYLLAIGLVIASAKLIFT
ncbi:sulfite exporter TauE/SafE family protein [Aquirufa nivalisilvae]|uniref:sulfite exporter TauE/SafE family protein n=1 Tax=Aquirufa nivalisilvae TaxID=2516557 RepID=UPI001032AD54|nr:sulfite exporter TauE/SafE family protein [Aquirufa nivalisilvae]MCZ2479071.1 sulfite exporter TauE/SafE family protein [Aquirufa nivalisilvae]MCZ2483264.1 sulfite exporter TauE/SafE family protein [Aquirufa nivalisilvae]TBH74916.1 sulfite exporter TauE/SafE family protein [Aquirufa nivalisilvae]